ncbi:MAG: histidine phosphatase family protein, partial [Actinomycetota bacterium]
SALFASPLQRAQESAAPWAEKYALPIQTDERLIEPTNKFEGGTYEFGPSILLHPRVWPWVMNPFKPSWGEPYAYVVRRMFAAIDDAWASVDSGEVVMVSHQMPIVMVQRAVRPRTCGHGSPATRPSCVIESRHTFASGGTTTIANRTFGRG